MVLVDAHCHLEKADFPDVEAVVSRAREAGVVHAVVVGQFQKPGDFGQALELARAWPDFLTPTLGIHPHDAAQATADDIAYLEATCRLPEVKAVGETGLDYYYDRSPRDQQKRLFARHCELAAQLGKPLVVHVRDAQKECWELLKGEGMSRGVIHCFSGNKDDARRYLDLGFYLSVSGTITYKKTDDLAAAVKFAPQDRLLVETDSPYLAPGPHRGKKNEPSFVGETAKKVAELKGLAEDGFALLAARNAKALFGLVVELP